MGLLTNLVQMKSGQDLQKKRAALDSLAMVLSDERARPEMREWANQSILSLVDDTFGGKGGGKGGKAGGISGLFHNILGGLSNLNPATTGTSGMRQGLQRIAQSRPSGPMEMSEEQMQQLADQRAAAETGRKVATTSAEQNAQIKARQRIVEQNPQLFRTEADKDNFVLFNKPAPETVRPVAMRDVAVKGPDGKAFQGLENPVTGVLYGPGPGGGMQELGAGYTRAEKGPGAAVNTQLWAKDHLNDPDPIVRKTAEDILASAEAKTRKDISQASVAELNAMDRKEQVAAVPEIVKGIMAGTIPPDRTGLGRNAGWLKILAGLSDKGFNMTAAELDWKAAQRYVASINSPQQLRVRQAAETAQQMIPDIRTLYNQWLATELPAGFKLYNKAALSAAKNLPGERGAIAQALETDINDMVADLGMVYMGGNSPTDHALDLAKSNLMADWNQNTFDRALDLINTNIGYRVNSFKNAGVAGMREESPYMPQGGQGITVPSGPVTDVQESKSTGKIRFSTDHQKTWTELPKGSTPPNVGDPAPSGGRPPISSFRLQ
jgi:hypothetical protein